MAGDCNIGHVGESDLTSDDDLRQPDASGAPPGCQQQHAGGGETGRRRQKQGPAAIFAGGARHDADNLACRPSLGVGDGRCNTFAPGFIQHVRDMGLLFKQRLAEIKDRHSAVVAEVRGEGLLMGLRMVPPVSEMVDELRNEKMITVAAGGLVSVAVARRTRDALRYADASR